MNNIYRTIRNDELSDFETHCQALGVDPLGFKLHEHDIIKTPLNEVMFITNAKLTISRNTSSKIYMTGDGSNWVEDFIDDLQKGVFN